MHCYIAVLAYQTAHSVSLRADDNGRRSCQICLIHRDRAFRSCAEDPDALFLQLLHSGVDVGNPGHLHTLARRLILQLDMAGCAFPEHPLAEGTGSLHNCAVLQKRLALTSLEEAWAAALQGLCERVLAFTPRRYEKPRAKKWRKKLFL